jgi:DNA-directed RNA polymerase specialized sigma54-like protein
MNMPWTDEQIEEASKAFEDFDPDGAAVVDVSDLRAIAEAADAARRNEATLTERVAIARAHGRSWNRIAVALGVSRQAARQRFGKVDA